MASSASLDELTVITLEKTKLLFSSVVNELLKAENYVANVCDCTSCSSQSTDLVEMEVNSADHQLLDKDIVGSSDVLCENHGNISILTVL